MQRTLAQLNEEQRALGAPDLAMGIGIHTGDVIVGNIGSERRTKYGAVGAAINLVYHLKGIADVVTLYDVVAVHGTYAVALPHTTRMPLVPIEPPLPVLCHEVDEGRVAAVGIAGHVERASRDALEVRLARAPEHRSTVLVAFDDAGSPRPDQAYGKVERVDTIAGGDAVALIVLTSFPPDAQRLLQRRSSTDG